MASVGTVKALVALSITGAAASLIEKQIQGERRVQVTREIRKVKAAIVEVRRKWPDLTISEMSKFDGMANPLVRAIKGTRGLPAHTLTWISRLLLEYVQIELWDHNSTKGGAIDEVLKCIEDLHNVMRCKDEAGCRMQAETMFREWLKSLDTPVLPVWKRKII